MALLNLYEGNSSNVLSMSIKQIVTMARDGNLKDNNATSLELRQFLSKIQTKYFSRYIKDCLESSFDNSGFVLQDITNELGRRLGYNVTNGLYRGKKNAIGFDGIWKIDGSRDIIIEVKTTDYYNIRLDQIFSYKKQCITTNNVSQDAMVLFIVGRDNSNSLEAQIRGSRYAWDARLISIEALLNLVFIKEKTQDINTLEKIRALIEPIEYTRLDRLVDVVFLSIEDAEKSVENEIIQQEFNNSQSDTDNEHCQQPAESTNNPIDTVLKKERITNRTPIELIEEKRQQAITILAKNKNTTFIKYRRTQFESSDKSIHAVITFSKRYYEKKLAYWVVYHFYMENFLQSANEGYFIIAMMDKDYIFAIPFDKLTNIVPYLNHKIENKHLRYHLALYKENDTFVLNLPLKSEVMSLEEFKLS